MLDFLRSEGIDEEIIGKIESFRRAYPLEENNASRVPVPRFRYYGKDIWEKALIALLSGENVLLVGAKATGKNVLAENLAAVFNRPEWDISFYLNTDAASLIGTDTFRSGEVRFRKGPVTQCAEEGGFGVLDEINMAKNESLAVLHATLDFRRELIKSQFPALKQEYSAQLAGLFEDIRKKCENSEISTKALDLRGLLAAISLVGNGLSLGEALELGIVNKSFDDFERQLVSDMITTRIDGKLTRTELFES